jgi:glycogen phosphorylase
VGFALDRRALDPAAGKERWRGDVSALTADILRLSDEDLWHLARASAAISCATRASGCCGSWRGTGRLEAAAHIARQRARPDALTLGFARRFASYKRPNLLLSDPARLRRLLTTRTGPCSSSSRARRIRATTRARADPAVGAVRGRPDVHGAHVVFLDDYDMRLATELVQGVDVWINTPRRPWEASGTSGMKVLVNGGLNLSTLDGWWAEAFDPITAGRSATDPSPVTTTRRRPAQLYSLLEHEVVPAFYDRDAAGFHGGGSRGCGRAWPAWPRDSAACGCCRNTSSAPTCRAPRRTAGVPTRERHREGSRTVVAPARTALVGYPLSAT